MSDGYTRREVLKAALASPIVAAVSQLAPAQDTPAQPGQLRNAAGRVVIAGDPDAAKQVQLVRRWRGSLCNSRLINRGHRPVRIKEVILFDIPISHPPQTKLYGEGFQMLTQTGGTLGQPVNYSQYTDAQHYKLPTPADARVFYGLVIMSLPADHTLYGFTSCRRFAGQFYLRSSSLQIVVDTEGRELGPGETWILEEFTVRSGSDTEELMAVLARQ